MLSRDILITGFEAFGGHQDNPSARVLEDCPQVLDGWHFSTAILPVSYQQAPQQLQALLSERHWAAVLLLGLADESPGWRIETQACNRNGATADNDGVVRAEQPVIAGEPQTLPGGLPAEAMLEALRVRGLPVSLSRDAGDYLCNHLFFHLMAWSRHHAADMIGGFVHVPRLSADPTAATSLVGHQRALLGLLEALAGYLSSRLGQRIG